MTIVVDNHFEQIISNLMGNTREKKIGLFCVQED